MRTIIEYDLSIRTSNIRYAGTDNDVFITVYGQNEGVEVSTNEINLSKRVNGNAFEKNATHNLSFQWEDIGRPTKIKLRLSNDLLDDWQFAECKITRKGQETNEEDPEINQTVTFAGNDKVFHRKDSYIFTGDKKPLREIVSESQREVFGGIEYITLPTSGETQIRTNFILENSNVIENTTVTQYTSSHSSGVNIEVSNTPGSTGGWGGKVGASYGFSYNILKSCADKVTQTLKESTSKETMVKIVNLGSKVTEYSTSGTIVEKSVSESSDRTFAIIYEKTLLTVNRLREGASIYTKRCDILNLGKRVRAILPLDINSEGNLIYVDAKQKIYSKDELYQAVGLLKE